MIHTVTASGATVTTGNGSVAVTLLITPQGSPSLTGQGLLESAVLWLSASPITPTEFTRLSARRLLETAVFWVAPSTGLVQLTVVRPLTSSGKTGTDGVATLVRTVVVGGTGATVCDGRAIIGAPVPITAGGVTVCDGYAGIHIPRNQRSDYRPPGPVMRSERIRRRYYNASKHPIR